MAMNVIQYMLSYLTKGCDFASCDKLKATFNARILPPATHSSWCDAAQDLKKLCEKCSILQFMLDMLDECVCHASFSGEFFL